MKKRFFCILLAAALLLAGCTTAATVPDTTAAPDVVEIPVGAAPTEAPDENPSAGDVVAAESTTTIEQHVTAMLPVLDSIMRTIGIEGEYAYAPTDENQIWNTLYLMGVNWNGSDARITLDGDTIVVPAAVMADFARAAFRLDALPSLPAEMYAAVTYDEAQDAYRLAPSDMGEADIYITGYMLYDDGSLGVEVSLYTAFDLLGQLDFDLLADSKSFSGYSVGSVRRADADSACWQSVAPDTETSVDLDGDGVSETVTVSVGEDDSCTLTVQYGDAVLTKQLDYFYNATLHIADTDLSDGMLELYLVGDTGSDDYDTYIYRLKDGAIETTSLFGSPCLIDGSGRMVLERPVDILGTWSGECDYRFDSAGFTFTRSSNFRIRQYLGSWIDRPITLDADGLTCTDASGSTVTLSAGSTLLPLTTDLAGFVICERPDGSLVRLSVSERTEEWGWNVNGTFEDDWFSGLLYAG